MLEMLIIKHVKNHYDVFIGEGYDFHSRIILERGVARNATGRVLNKDCLAYLAKSIDTRQHYQKLKDF